MTSRLHSGWLAALALCAPLPAMAAPLPPPSLANDCGRGAEVFLAPVAGSQAPVPIPMTAGIFDAVSIHYLHKASFEEQGAVRLQVLVNQDGQPAQVSVTDTSAPPAMTKAVMDTVKAYYRWQAPPPECRDRGAVVSIVYLNTWAVPQLQIYSSDPRYPAAAHEHKMGAAGIAEMSFKGPDEVWNVKVIISMGSPALDDGMVKAAKDLVTEAIKNRNDRHSITGNFAVMFMPDYLPAPASSSENSMTIPAFTIIPGLPLDQPQAPRPFISPWPTFNSPP